MANLNSKEIFEILKNILIEEFEINSNDITLDAGLFDDLDLDSVDAVDMAVRLQQYTHKKVSPEEFKQIKTVGDVVKAVEKLIQE